MFQELEFPVELTSIPHPRLAGEVIKDRKAILRTDTNDVLNIVSKRYQLARHQEVFSAMDQAVNKVGIAVKNVKVRTGDKGGSAGVTWTLDKTLQINEKDLVDITIIGRNSYNYMSMVGLELGAYRLICSNGARIGQMLVKNQKRHVPSLNVNKMVEEITLMLEKVALIQTAWQSWDHKEYAPARLSGWMETQPQISQKSRSEILDYFTVQPDNLRAGLTARYTGWEAWNALTWAATHRVHTRTTDRQLVASEVMDGLAVHFAATELMN